MNQKKETVGLFGKTHLTKRQRAVLLYLQSLITLAPKNIPGMVRSLRGKMENYRPWMKEINDLAILARDHPGRFLDLAEGKTMKTIKIKRIKLKPEYIKGGYATIVVIGGYECALSFRPIGLEDEGTKNDILGKTIAQKRKNSYSFLPYLAIELSVPPVSKNELAQIILAIGEPNKQRRLIQVEGQTITVSHDFSHDRYATDFYNWSLYLKRPVPRSCQFYSEAETWEKELSDFSFKVMFSFNGFEPSGGDSIEQNYTVPEYFKEEGFRLKILLACLETYFGLPVDVG